MLPGLDDMAKIIETNKERWAGLFEPYEERMNAEKIKVE